MSVFNEIRSDVLSGGTNVAYEPGTQHTEYILHGPGSPSTLNSDIHIYQNIVSESITAYEGTTYIAYYTGNYIYGTGTITIFGRVLTASEALRSLYIKAVYTSGAWIVQVLYDESFSTKRYTLTSGGGTTYINPYAGLTYIIHTPSPITLSSSYTFDVDPALLDLTKDAQVRVYYSANATLSTNNITIMGKQLTQRQASGTNIVIIDSVFDIDTGSFITSVSESAGLIETIAVPVSFETNEVGNISVPVDYNCNLLKVKYSVSKTLTDTDAGSLTVTDGGFVTYASLSIPLSSTVGTTNSISGTPLASKASGGTLVLHTSKTTPGGRAICFLTLQRT